MPKDWRPLVHYSQLLLFLLGFIIHAALWSFVINGILWIIRKHEDFSRRTHKTAAFLSIIFAVLISVGNLLMKPKTDYPVTTAVKPQIQEKESWWTVERKEMLKNSLISQSDDSPS